MTLRILVHSETQKIGAVLHCGQQVDIIDEVLLASAKEHGISLSKKNMHGRWTVHQQDDAKEFALAFEEEWYHNGLQQLGYQLLTEEEYQRVYKTNALYVKYRSNKGS